jgi:hypothetical protein
LRKQPPPQCVELRLLEPRVQHEIFVQSGLRLSGPEIGRIVVVIRRVGDWQELGWNDKSAASLAFKSNAPFATSI